MAAADNQPIPRGTTCPFVLRAFVHADRREVSHYEETWNEAESIVMHTWMDATFNELMEQVREQTGTDADKRLVVSVLYPNKEGKMFLRHLASVPGVGGTKELRETSFQSGDYLDVMVE